MIECRVTVNLKGACVGDTPYVNPSDPYIAACIRQGILVPTGAPVDETVEGLELAVDP